MIYYVSTCTLRKYWLHCKKFYSQQVNVTKNHTRLFIYLSSTALHVIGTNLKGPPSCRGLMKRQRTIAVTGWARCQHQVAFVLGVSCLWNLHIIDTLFHAIASHNKGFFPPPVYIVATDQLAWWSSIYSTLLCVRHRPLMVWGWRKIGNGFFFFGVLQRLPRSLMVVPLPCLGRNHGLHLLAAVTPNPWSLGPSGTWQYQPLNLISAAMHQSSLHTDWCSWSMGHTTMYCRVPPLQGLLFSVAWQDM